MLFSFSIQVSLITLFVGREAAAALDEAPASPLAGKGAIPLRGRPRYILAEEHHHVAPHLLRMASEGFLRAGDRHDGRNGAGDGANEKIYGEGVENEGALLIHVDSHSDGNLSPTWTGSIPRSWSPRDADGNDIRAMASNFLSQVDIYNFILPLGYANVVEHFVFVEPPWAYYFRPCYKYRQGEPLGMGQDDYYHSWYIYIGYEEGNDDDAGDEAIRRSRFFLTDAYGNNDDFSSTCYTSIRSTISTAPDPSTHVASSLSDLYTFCGGRSNVKRMRFTPVRYEDAPRVLPCLLHNDFSLQAGNTSGRKSDVPVRRRPLWLDIDLDGFGTFSPGGKAMYDAIPDWGDLMTISHTLNSEFLRQDATDEDLLGEIPVGMCDFDVFYWKNVIDGDDPRLNCNRTLDAAWMAGVGDFTREESSHWDSVDSITVKGKSNASRKARRRLRNFLHTLNKDVRQEVFDAVAEIFTKHDDTMSFLSGSKGGIHEKLHDFISHPFHVNEDTIDILVDYWEKIWRDMFTTRKSHAESQEKDFAEGEQLSLIRTSPDVITVVRSPFYTPHHHLRHVECSVLGALVRTFGSGSGVIEHGSDVQLERTGCIREIREAHEGGGKEVEGLVWSTEDVGTIGETIGDTLWSVDAHDWIYSDLFPKEEEIILHIVFKNGKHDNDDPIPTGILLFENGKPLNLLKPGDEIELSSSDGEAWTIRPIFLLSDERSNSAVSGFDESFVLDSFDGFVQQFDVVLTSINAGAAITSEIVPVENETPVELYLVNPSDSSIYEVYFIGTIEDNDLSGLERLGPGASQDAPIEEVIYPGQSVLFDTYHNHIFMAIKRDEENEEESPPVKFVVADASDNGLNLVSLHREL